MNPVLSPEEMEALRASTTPQAPQADPVNLGARDRGLRRKLPWVSKRLEVFTESMRVLLSKELHAPISVDQLAPEIVGPKAIQTLFGTWAAMAEAHTLHGDRAVLIGVGPVMALAFVELSFGADLENLSTEAKRNRLTDVERQTLAPLLSEVGRQLAVNLGAGDTVVTDLPFPFQVDFDPEASALQVAFEFVLGTQKARIDTLIWEDALEQSDAAGVQDPAQARTRIASNLTGAQVEVRATLGSAQIPIETLATLVKGQVLWLNGSRTEPIPVYVEDRLAFMGQPVQRHGTLGVEIVTRVA